ncbi:MAG: hypothetical protein H6738_16080 [Alphaproteobacteria bacterium]|nr:hypothetical protein [Alphaproteobacteria bacterium]MCB9698298.1 hypothetical protein [Alphaproteobacteria bacterium]
MRKIETFDWWPELVQVKDDYSLRELAERFKVTPGAITAAFKRTGTRRRSAPPGPRARRKGRAETDDALDAGAIQSRPHSKDDALLPYRDQLGQVPDSEIAGLAGVSVRTVASFRARNDIAGYAGPPRRRADPGVRSSRIDAFEDLVGSVPDQVVATKAGVSVNAVRNWRIKRGITAHAHARGQVSPAAAPATSRGGAWKVISGTGAERSVRVVVASSLSEAATRVESAGVGPVLSLEWIAEVL